MGYLIGGLLIALGVFFVVGGSQGDATKVLEFLTGKGLPSSAGSTTPKDGTATAPPNSLLPPGKQYVDGTGNAPTVPGGTGHIGTPASYPQRSTLPTVSV